MSSLATVLVIDDEVRSLEALRRVLDDDFEVLCAKDAEEAENSLKATWCTSSCATSACPGSPASNSC